MILLITSRVACVFRKYLNIDNSYDCKKLFFFFFLNTSCIWSAPIQAQAKGTGN